MAKVQPHPTLSTAMWTAQLAFNFRADKKTFLLRLPALPNHPKGIEYELPFTEAGFAKAITALRKHDEKIEYAKTQITPEEEQALLKSLLR